MEKGLFEFTVVINKAEVLEKDQEENHVGCFTKCIAICVCV
jgi:hypothetical protein